MDVMEYRTEPSMRNMLRTVIPRPDLEKSTTRKTMAGSFAAELLGSLQFYEYRKCIPYISPGMGIPRDQFATRDDHNRWQIDTSLTFRGKRCKTLNPNFLFSIFGRYSGDEPGVVRTLMIKWINENRQAFDKATFIGMAGKDVEFDTWLLNMESQRTVGDEFALYALCKLFNRHARVLTRGNTWHTVSIEGSYDESYIEKACDIHLLFLAKNTIAELRKRTVGKTVPPDETNTVTPLAKPLGLHNMVLPDVNVPELPDETIQLTGDRQASHTTNTGDYVMTLGMVIPLPEKDLEIDPDLLQRDPDISEIEPTDKFEKNTLIHTPPCTIKLRRLVQQDIVKWQVKKAPMILPDATMTTKNPELMNTPKYNLRIKSCTPIKNSSSDRPQRESSKSITYTEPADESSQDSQVIGTVYFVDLRPLPNAKLKKIVGLSEPSAYRLGAQSYIDAKKRGEILPPPKRTLPGFKVTPNTESEKSTAESVDSDATEIYDPPELPDRTDLELEVNKPIKGKLQITKLILRKPKKKTHHKRMFKCVRCSFLCKTIEELNEHFIGKHRNLKCSDCNKSFNKPRSYQKHLYLHKKPNHRCDICGKGFSFRSQLTAHLPVHTSLRTHCCTSPKCNRSFTHAGDLKKHLKTHSKKWWRCEIAGCTYKNRDERNLKSHMINHNTCKKFTCKYCQQKFLWSMQLVRHYKKGECIRAKRSSSPSF